MTFDLAQMIAKLRDPELIVSRTNAADTLECAAAEIIRLTARVEELEVVEQSKAARDVIAERHRQIDGEGWTPDHDDAYFPGKLAQAGACYAMNAGAPFFANRPPSCWPFTTKWWKPTTPRRDLVKAAALILAEIERLDRAALSTPTEEPKT